MNVTMSEKILTSYNNNNKYTRVNLQDIVKLKHIKISYKEYLKIIDSKKSPLSSPLPLPYNTISTSKQYRY